MTRPNLTTADGLTLSARRWLVEGVPRCAVVVVHGFSASASCPNVEALSTALHEDSFDVVTYDARGHGGSPGESTLGDDEQHDVAAAVALARTRTDRVVLVGASMGAIAALRYAVTDPALAGAVAVSCPAEWKLPRNVRGVLAAAMTRTPIGRHLTSRLVGVRIAARWTNPDPPLSLATRLRVPVTYVHGTADKFVPADDAVLLASVTPEPCRVQIIPGMGHAFEPVAIDPIREAVEWSIATTHERA